MSRPEDKIVPLPLSKDVEVEAASWLTVLGRETVSEKDLTAFKAWLQASERNRSAFRSLESLWADLEVLRDLDDIAEAMIEQTSNHRSVVPRRAVLAGAAAMIGIVVAGSFWFAGERQEAPQSVAFATHIGDQQSVELSDGSTVQLNTNSAIEVEYSRAHRRIRLLRGEAHFDVAKNAERPFSVEAADGVVQAIGTAFTVRLRVNDAIEVTVEEGQVALAALSDTPVNVQSTTIAADEAAQLAQLTAGQTAVFSKHIEQLDYIPVPELKRKLAWRQGMLAYSGDTLADVIADISRYTDIKIEISDPNVASRKVAGYFRVGQVDALFESLELNFGLHVERVNEKLVRLNDAS